MTPRDGPPLVGVRVLDLSRVLAGPLCAMTLADLGAEVVKVERPGVGDETRAWGPPYQGGQAAYFLAVNRLKRSCAIDLSTPDGRAVVHDLARAADVLVENFRGASAARLGLDPARLWEVNPSLIVCSISGFGSRRSPADRPGYDFTAQAESGLMSITGHPDGEPTKVGVAAIDVLTGLQAAVAVLAALVRRRETGEGEHVEVSLLDAGLAGLVNVAANALAQSANPPRLGNAHPNIVPYQTFRASDGWLAVAAANDGAFVRLCDALGLPELRRDPRFETNPQRVRHRDELVELLAARFADGTTARWLEVLERAGVPVGRVRGVLDALRAAEAAGDPATVVVEHPTAGPLELVRSPIRLANASLPQPEPPPRLGEHTGQVLAAAGYDAEAIRRLHRDGVIDGLDLGDSEGTHPSSLSDVQYRSE